MQLKGMEVKLVFLKKKSLKLGNFSGPLLSKMGSKIDRFMIKKSSKTKREKSHFRVSKQKVCLTLPALFVPSLFTIKIECIFTRIIRFQQLSQNRRGPFTGNSFICKII